MPTSPNPSLARHNRITFVGGGNMANAIVGGLIAHGLPAQQITALEPNAETRAALQDQHGIHAIGDASQWTQADLIVWAVKPQIFKAAAAPVAPHIGHALQLSIMAGVHCHDIATASGHARMVRAMPNTPALIGQGVSALYASAGISAADRQLAEAVMQSTGRTLWVAEEKQLDAVTALSGSGPAYVFYFLQAMQQAGTELGLSADTARQLAQQTFAGAAALAAQSPESLATLRERVTSKGGTTFAALSAMESADMQTAFVRAMHAAHRRAQELGDAPGQ